MIEHNFKAAEGSENVKVLSLTVYYNATGCKKQNDLLLCHHCCFDADKFFLSNDKVQSSRCSPVG